MTQTSRVVEGLLYTPDHEWVRTEGHHLTIGITDHAQAELTDVVFADLPRPGKEVQRHDVVLTLESVKTVAEVYAPTEGKVTQANEDLRAHPELINQDPYGRGWIFQMESAQAPSGLMSAEEYRAFLAAAGPSAGAP
jgi:glycine cleavage system H protein